MPAARRPRGSKSDEAASSRRPSRTRRIDRLSTRSERSSRQPDARFPRRRRATPSAWRKASASKHCAATALTSDDSSPSAREKAASDTADGIGALDRAGAATGAATSSTGDGAGDVAGASSSVSSPSSESAAIRDLFFGGSFSGALPLSHDGPASL